MKRLIITLIFTGLIIGIAGCNGGAGGNNTTGEGGNSGSMAVKDTITKYFNGYYDAQKTLNYTRMNAILADNDNIKLNEKYRETEVAFMRTFECPISDYHYKLEYQNISVTETQASADLVLDLDLHYPNAPADVKTGIYGVKYHFDLKNDGSGWRITAISSNFEFLVSFKEEVQQQMAKNASLKFTDAVEQVGKVKLNRLQMMRGNSLYLRGSAAAPSETTPDSSASSSDVTKSVYHAYTDYEYNKTNAINYANKYAVHENPLFCYYDGDCTNFVSQCIWAGYGGSGNDVASQSHMVPGEWFGGKGSCSNIWIRVVELWGYLLKSKPVGPQGVGYNDGKLYTALPASSINPGDVLQLRNPNNPEVTSRNRYSHSAFVTSKNGSDYPSIFVAYHSRNKMDVRLIDLVNGFGGSSCYMRRIALTSPRPLYHP